MTSRASYRLAVVAGVFVSLMLLVCAMVLLAPDRSLARAKEPGTGGPASIPPLNPPIQTPEPDQLVGAQAAQGADLDVQVRPFRPPLRRKRGESGAVLQSAQKATTKEQMAARDASPGGNHPLQSAYVAPQYAQVLSPMEWNLMAYEDFEWDSAITTTYPFLDPLWNLYDFGDDGYQRSWGLSTFAYYSPDWSAWPAAGGSDGYSPWATAWYTDNLASWMTYGPFDFSTMSDVFVGFGLYYDTEPEWDWVYFCASIDDITYNCDYWSGYSDGWTDQAYWLSAYAGYPQVWLAWIFESDASVSNGYYGPYVDEITVWGNDMSATPTPTPTPDPQGQLVENGSFETGDLTSWMTETVSSLATAQRVSALSGEAPAEKVERIETTGTDSAREALAITAVGVSDLSSVEGDHAAYLWRSGGTGLDSLYQTISVPADADDVTLNFWFGVTTTETLVGQDWFCISMADPADHNNVLVSLGCLDATDATGYWQEFLYSLEAGELGSVAGQSVDLVFDAFSDIDYYGQGQSGTGATTSWVDYVQLYATGGSSGGASVDPNEPNDDFSNATAITCGQTVTVGTTITGIVGDALGGYDIDFFQLTNVPSGQIDVDINADTQVPRSALDSVVGLYDNGQNLVAQNDDDGVSFDSYVTYTNEISGTSYYISVESYSGSGGPDSFYDLNVRCSGGGSGPPPAGTDKPQTITDTWTVMLYLNAEDPNFEEILRGYRQDIEAFIGNKSSFLTVTILYDGPPDSTIDSGTTRYVVQPNGVYNTDPNRPDRWNLGELNMGDPDTLSDFVNWSMDQFPAEHYYLAIDDHGDGAYGISFDATSQNDQLTPPELYSALKNGTRNGARKIDIFDYEACLMGLAENAYDLREWVDYVIFFEQISWGLDTYPNYFNDLAPTDGAEEVGRRIIDRYYDNAYNANSGAGYPHTISLIDTGQMANVRQAVSNFGDALQATGNQSGVEAARDNSQAFAADLDATNPVRADYIDLWDLADQASSLAPSQAAAVKSAVDAAVVHEKHASGVVSGYTWDHDGAHGLSIYYPPAKSSSAFSGYDTLYQMSQDGTWDTFLDWAVPTGIGRGMNSFRAEIKLTEGDAYVFKEDVNVYLPLVVHNYPLPPSPSTLYPTGDATVLQAYPANNLGNTADMWVGYDHCTDANAQVSRSLVQFDLSTIPTGWPIAQATLSLYLENSCDIGERTHTVTTYRVIAPWSEASVTWNNQPGFAEAYGSAAIPSRTWARYNFDVTGLVRGWANGSFANHGLMLRGPEGSGNDSARLGFLTVDASDADFHPYLIITYGGAAAQAEQDGPAGTPVLTGVAKRISETLEGVVQHQAPEGGAVEWTPASSGE